MPAVTTFVAVTALAAGAYSADQQNKAGKAAAATGRANGMQAAIGAGAEAGAMRFQGEEAMRVAREEAERVKAEARQFRGAQKALAAASGFVVDQGTAETLSDETENLAQSDALAYLFDGAQKHAASVVGSANIIESGSSNAASILQQGYNAQSEMRGRATSTLINSFGNFAANSSVQKAAGFSGTKK